MDSSNQDHNLDNSGVSEQRLEGLVCSDLDQFYSNQTVMIGDCLEKFHNMLDCVVSHVDTSNLTFLKKSVSSSVTATETATSSSMNEFILCYMTLRKQSRSCTIF